MVLRNLYQRLAKVASSLSIRNNASPDHTETHVENTPRQIDAKTPMTIDDVLGVFEQRGAQHLSGRVRLPQEASDVPEYFDAMGVKFIADPDDGIKYGILLDGRVPQTLSGEGASPVAIYGGYFQMPPKAYF